MTEEDIFFTHTVVGQALSVEMGRPLDRQRAETYPSGLQTSLASGSFSLPQVWKEWCLIQGAYPYAGLPRRRPGRFRRWLERHALILAAVGVLMLLFTTSLLVGLIWFPDLLSQSWLPPNPLIGPKL